MPCKISLSCTWRNIIFAALLSSASSIPVPSNLRTIKCITEAIFPPRILGNIPRRYPVVGSSIQEMESPGAYSFNLNKSAIATLSKIANLRVQNPAVHRRISIPLEKSSSLMTKGNGVFGKNTSVDMLEKVEFKPRQFHCHPIEDIYIPAIDKMVPAYICKLDSREFILSSERFYEDNKYHLDVSVDETTFHGLAIPDKISTGNSVANFIPVTLTQRKGEEFYGVKRT